MIIYILLLIIGFTLLSRGADILVDGASAIARKFNIPEIVIGLTIVACGTSLPEAAVSISSVINGVAEVGIGNILGSNIANILLILGICSLVCPLYVQRNTILYEIPFVGFISILIMFMGWHYGMISRGGAIILCMLFILFLGYLWIISKNTTEQNQQIQQMSMTKMVCFIICGIAALIIGAKITINATINIAHILHISERIIGLTIVALGTSLPELITCVVAAKKQHSDIAIGNIVGSNIFNILFVLGITGLIQPIQFESAFLIDAALGVMATVLLCIFVFYDRRLTWTKGVIFLILYAIYIVHLVK